MRTIGWILAVIVGGLIAYVVYSIATGSSAFANTLSVTAGTKAKPNLRDFITNPSLRQTRSGAGHF